MRKLNLNSNKKLPKIISINISQKKGEKKIPVLSCEVIKNFGIKDDAHAGNWHRQISLLEYEKIQLMKKAIPEIQPGDFAENFTTIGINISSYKIGTKFKIGNNVVIEITQIGKECHSGCNIQKLTGACIMPKFGVFAKVLTSGIVNVNDPITIID